MCVPVKCLHGKVAALSPVNVENVENLSSFVTNSDCFPV